MVLKHALKLFKFNLEILKFKIFFFFENLIALCNIYRRSASSRRIDANVFRTLISIAAYKECLRMFKNV